MELFRTSDFYIFTKDEYSLWWDRSTGAFIPKTGWDLTDAEDPICLGIIDGIIGKVEHPIVFNTRLLLIKESLPVGKLHNEPIHKIKSIVFLPLGPENIELNLLQCPKHNKKLGTISDNSNSNSKSNSNNVRKQNTNFLNNIQSNVALTKTWNTLKNAGNTIKSTTQHAAAMAAGAQIKGTVRDKQRFEKQIIEEFYKMFTDTDSFYYSQNTDLTNSLQRLCHLEKDNLINPKSLWRTADDRFFWNKYMLKDLIDLDNPLCDPWILPIIQGYIQIEDCKVELAPEYQTPEKKYEIFILSILSRRSRYRAGTRYKRRGVNENGECANYVETEQLISYHHHEMSFVQVRGSVPIYWSQPGYKYRPPPRIDKGESETMEAFEKHFSNEIQQYGPVTVINLIDQSGKEKVIFDAYSDYILKYNSPFITYVTYDFHEYCRGMHFENVSILINALSDIIKDMNYCWRDKQGHVCSQIGVFRVNCIDCLDRTNVVQTALGKAVLEIQLCKFGLITPEGIMPRSIKNTFQLLWANNGDVISKQYAGTNALKGDYTRTGERRFTGIMKDGMNSANRYFKCHFKDSLRQCCLNLMQGIDNEIEIVDLWSQIKTLGLIINEITPEPVPYLPDIALEQEYKLAYALYQLSRYYLSRFKDSTRQGTIDFMLGEYVSEDIFNETKSLDEEDSLIMAEHVKLLLEDCKKMLLNQSDIILGSWGLINADPVTGDPNESEMDSILLLTKDSYIYADYDDQVDKITKYEIVQLENLTMLECGLIDISGNSLFKTLNKFCIRINYKFDGESGYYHMFRSTNLRFFNNMAVVIKNEEEEIESLKAICEAFIVALDVAGLPPVPYICGKTLEKRKSKMIQTSNKAGRLYLDIDGLSRLTRNTSESQLLALKNVGSKALLNMSNQFAKLSTRKNKRKPSTKSNNNKQNEQEKQELSSNSDSDCDTSIYQPSNSDGQTNDNNIDLDSSSSSSHHKFLPSVGIVMGQQEIDNEQESNNVQMTNTPQIQINNEIDGKSLTPLKLDGKLSHSSGDVDDNAYFTKQRSTSDYDLSLNISQSQSESALKNCITNIKSPVATTTKDLVFSPFSKLAKGVQNLGANFDPRKLSFSKQITEKDMEEHRKLLEKWQNSKTRLIAL